MPTYSNGNVPPDLMITFNSGYDDLGYWEHLWPAHTIALANALIARAAARRAAAGLTAYALRLQTGWTAYRPLYWQQVYRNLLGDGAARPGTSSHGGTFEGSQTMAGDWAWQTVYRDCGGVDAFFADCRAVGLLPGMIMASRGYPDEEWHVIDPNPWAPIPARLDSSAFPTAQQGEDMYIIRAEGRTPTLVGPGYTRSLNDEEAANIGAIVSKDTTVNPRQFDLSISAASGEPAGPKDGMFVASSPNRPKALFGPGFYRELNDEEAANVGPFTNRSFVLNDRQYDLHRSIASSGVAAVDASAVRAAIADALKGVTVKAGPIDDAAADKLANRVADVVRERLAN